MSCYEEVREDGGKWADRPMFAYDADVTVYWPDVRPCYEEVEDAELARQRDETRAATLRRLREEGDQ